MRRVHLLSFLLFYLFCSFASFAQESDGVSYPTFKIDGSLKNKFEVDTESGMSRFSVRNARLGAKGNINSFASYRVQVDLSNEGKFNVLDLSAILEPIDGFTVTFGQTSIPLFNGYIVGPAEMIFANRAFIGKYFLGTRDLGVLGKYAFKAGALPVSIEAGAFNANTINNPAWRGDLAYGGRLGLGSMKGLRFTAKTYSYPNSDDNNFLFYGADLRYEAQNWKVETEVMKKESKSDNNDLLSWYVQSAYSFPIKTKIFDFFIPAVRWDAINERSNVSGFDVNRLTTGLGFGFNEKNFSSILRFDYEWYMVNHDMLIFAENNAMDASKFIVELVISF
jgi:hypothetical protein